MTTNFVEKGAELIKQAVLQDNDANYEAALNLYSQGIQYLMTGLKYEKNAAVKTAIKEKVVRFLERAEEITQSLQIAQRPESLQTDMNNDLEVLRRKLDAVQYWNAEPPEDIKDLVRLIKHVETADEQDDGIEVNDQIKQKLKHATEETNCGQWDLETVLLWIGIKMGFDVLDHAAIRSLKKNNVTGHVLKYCTQSEVSSWCFVESYEVERFYTFIEILRYKQQALDAQYEIKKNVEMGESHRFPTLFTVLIALFSSISSVALTDALGLSNVDNGIVAISMSMCAIIMALIKITLSIKSANKYDETERRFSFKMKAIAVLLATFSDSSFDFFQGCAAINEEHYTNSAFTILVISTWVGVGDEILECFVEIFFMTLEEDCVKSSFIIIFIVWSIIEAVMGIYLLTTHKALIYKVSGIAVTAILIVVSIIFLLYFVLLNSKNKKMTKQKEILKKSLDELDEEIKRMALEEGRYVSVFKQICERDDCETDMREKLKPAARDVSRTKQLLTKLVELKGELSQIYGELNGIKTNIFDDTNIQEILLNSSELFACKGIELPLLKEAVKRYLHDQIELNQVEMKDMDFFLNDDEDDLIEQVIDGIDWQYGNNEVDEYGLPEEPMMDKDAELAALEAMMN